MAYGGIRAVKGIDLAVESGETVCLIGANGAGKTTTLRAITGLVRSAGGRIRYGGDDIGKLRVHEIAQRGLALVPEGRGVFPQLTIEENLAMGAYARKDRAAVRGDLAHAFELFLGKGHGRMSPYSPRYASRTRGSPRSDFAGPERVMSPPSRT